MLFFMSNTRGNTTIMCLQFFDPGHGFDECSVECSDECSVECSVECSDECSVECSDECSVE